jgi:hypothetical protein
VTLPLFVVSKPYALPAPPDGPFVMLDVAFAGAGATWKTHQFIDDAAERLRLWVDHHEHPEGWARYVDDARFVLVPSKRAHACPELVTPEVVARAGDVRDVLAHHDFDGLMSAVRFFNGGREPYEGADEDARASDSPGRGHVLSERGLRLSTALGEATAELEEAPFLDFYREIASSVLAGREDVPLAAALDRFVKDAEGVRARALVLAERRRVEAPGVAVLRLEARLDGRMRRAVLSILEDEAAIGLVLEGSPKRWWATAATYHEEVVLDEAADLDRGRHDFRFGPTKDGDGLVALLSRLAVRAGRA